MGRKFTIIIPVCIQKDEQKRLDFFKRCYYSCLNQSHPVEIIIADNESTDNIRLSIAPYAATHKDTKFVSAENLYVHSWHEPVHAAWEVMTGDYFTIVAYDDFLDEDYIKNINKVLEMKEFDAIQSPIRPVNSEGAVVRESDLKHSYRNLKEFKQEYLIRCPVNTPSVVYRAALAKSGQLESAPETYYGYDDYFLYGLMADQDIFIASFPKWLGYYYRWHDAQATHSMKVEFPDLENQIQEFWRKKWNE